MCPSGTTTAARVTTPSNGLRRAFHLMDADGDGRISYDDLRRFLDGGDEATINSMMSMADSNGNGYVEFEEFEKILNFETSSSNNYNNYSRCSSRKVMEEAFRMMDRDGDGRVGHQDLKWYLNEAGVEADDEDVKAMISLASAQNNCEGDEDSVTLSAFLNIFRL